MKKVTLILMVFILCSCTSVQNKEYVDILNEFTLKKEVPNVYQTGYKYFIPKGLSRKKYFLYNDVLTSNKYDYYLYVDIISYYNKLEFNYKENDFSYYSKRLKFNKKRGYLEINLQENDQYLIEIMFNYAKIEVMVDKKDINLALKYCVTILNSIKYNDKIVENLVSSNALNYQEEIYNIFNTTSSDSTLKFDEDVSESEENIAPEEYKDSDLIS